MEKSSSKVKKGTTARKRGTEPSVGKSSAASSTSTSKTSGRNWGIHNQWKKIAPSYLTKTPSKKMLLDLAVFCGGVFVIYKYGSTLNQTLNEYVPSEASLRQKMAEAQLQMQAMQQQQMAAMQGGMM